MNIHASKNRVGILGRKAKWNRRQKAGAINPPPPSQYVSVLVKAFDGQDLMIHVTPEDGQSLDELRGAVREGLAHCGLAIDMDGVWREASHGQ